MSLRDQPVMCGSHLEVLKWHRETFFLSFVLFALSEKDCVKFLQAPEKVATWFWLP